jgi:hypothetical protein
MRHVGAGEMVTATWYGIYLVHSREAFQIFPGNSSIEDKVPELGAT